MVLLAAAIVAEASAITTHRNATLRSDRPLHTIRAIRDAVTRNRAPTAHLLRDRIRSRVPIQPHKAAAAATLHLRAAGTPVAALAAEAVPHLAAPVGEAHPTLVAVLPTAVTNSHHNLQSGKGRLSESRLLLFT